MNKLCVILCFVLTVTFSVGVVAEGAQCSACMKRCAYAKVKCPPVKCGTVQDPAGNGMQRKFGRGLANFLFGWPSELYNQMGKAHATGGPLVAMTWGLASGIGMGTVRCVVGLYEFVTFPFPIPPGYKPILDDPDFFWKDETF